jgi:hypothetical protein
MDASSSAAFMDVTPTAKLLPYVFPMLLKLS